MLPGAPGSAAPTCRARRIQSRSQGVQNMSLARCAWRDGRARGKGSRRERKARKRERERERGEKESARGGKQKRSQSNRMRRRRRTISAKRARRASGKARLDARRTSVSCAAESGVRVSKASSGLVETSAAGAGEMETRSACKRARAQAKRRASSTKRSRRASGESYLGGRRPRRTLHIARARKQSVERVRRNESGGRRGIPIGEQNSIGTAQIAPARSATESAK